VHLPNTGELPLHLSASSSPLKAGLFEVLHTFHIALENIHLKSTIKSHHVLTQLHEKTHINKRFVNRAEPKMPTANDRIFNNAAACESLMHKI
jgi:hypothetical protein